MGNSEDLDYLLREANPVLDPDGYVFVSHKADYGDFQEWKPIATVEENEGTTFILRKSVADAHRLDYDGVFSKITLQVHSSLNAVGLTAKFSVRLAASNISANVLAGFYHDHIFVAEADGARALAALATLADDT